MRRSGVDSLDKDILLSTNPITDRRVTIPTIAASGNRGLKAIKSCLARLIRQMAPERLASVA